MKEKKIKEKKLFDTLKKLEVEIKLSNAEKAIRFTDRR